MQKIYPMLWFDSQAEEAARFYTSVFPNSRVVRTTHYGSAGPRAVRTSPTFCVTDTDPLPVRVKPKTTGKSIVVTSPVS